MPVHAAKLNVDLVFVAVSEMVSIFFPQLVHKFDNWSNRFSVREKAQKVIYGGRIASRCASVWDKVPPVGVNKHVSVISSLPRGAIHPTPHNERCVYS